MAATEGMTWLRISTVAVVVATAAISVAAAFYSASISRRKWMSLSSHVRELEASLDACMEKAASERRGRVRVQQALRKALAQQSSNGSKSDSSFAYPMVPIGTVQSCFSTRNGTPRQPLLVPLSRACLVFEPGRVPPEALEGLAEYSHCWVLYVFHLNTDLEKLWKHPSRSKFKAKVRVPRLKGGKMGVLATRSPHRPCPIGLTVAKVEALDGRAILLSGVDLVDGTPVLDIKPYLPYSDSIQGATVPEWLKADNALAVASVSFSGDFYSSLSSCWATADIYYPHSSIMENCGQTYVILFPNNNPSNSLLLAVASPKGRLDVGSNLGSLEVLEVTSFLQGELQSLYASADEFQGLIKEVLSWDIRSLSQQSRPHQVAAENEGIGGANLLELDSGDDESHGSFKKNSSPRSPSDVTYHLILEEIDVSYRIDGSSNIMVEKATLLSDAKSYVKNRYNHSMWSEKLI